VEPEEIELLREAAADHGVAFAQLFERHHEAVYRFAYRFSRSQEVADDVTQETFIAALRGAGRLNGSTCSLRTWLFAIARNIVLKQTRHSRREEPLGESAEPGRYASNPVEEVLAVERSEAVQRAISLLPERQRVALILFEYEGLSLSEIADVVGESIGAVKSRLHRAREQLKIALAPYAPVPDRADRERR
jgi:RNA polymerase sigma-70 factor (ECF subfamily)